MSSASTPVLVIGAGELGNEILYYLATHPQRASSPVSVLLRPGAFGLGSHAKVNKYKAMKSHSVTFVSGDIDKDSIASLASTFAPYHTIIGASGMTQASGTQLKISQAVIAATELPGSRVRRYIPWQFGLDYDVIGRGSAQGLFTEQLDVRDALKAAQDKLSWVIVSTGIFMSFLFLSAFGVVVGLEPFEAAALGSSSEAPEHRGSLHKMDMRWFTGTPHSAALGDYQKQLMLLEQQNRRRLRTGPPQELPKLVVRALGSWENKVTYTTPKDIGRLTAEVVFAAPEVSNQVVFVAGDTASFGDIKAAVEKAVQGRENVDVSGEVWDLVHLRKSLSETPDDGMKKYQVVLAEGVGVAWDKAATFNAQRGIETQTLDEYALLRCGVLD